MIAGIMLLALGFKHMPTLVGEAGTEFLVSRRERQRLRRALIEEREGTCAARARPVGRLTGPCCGPSGPRVGTRRGDRGHLG
ncbi:hypothetical protein AB0C22_04795 [Micromonospora sp. NPDC048894]|uniref:hypothetical protein n=1 Tax=Micromonospora sp. NPDC048894 TaxID=3155493 RepID=UPI0033F73977